MALAQEDIEQIERIIDQRFAARPEMAYANVRYDLELRERVVRVEEELKHQRELMIQGFGLMEKRFEQIDKRFEDMNMNMNKRFEQVDKRFEQVDKRFELIDKRFEQIDKRLDQLVTRLDRFMIWSLGLTATAVFFVVNYLK
jgi:DNA anti-recombination protein RmuC